MTTEQQLIEACREIGNIVGSNSSFTAGLALKIKATGKQISDLTVCELLSLAREYKETFNQIHAT